MQSQIPSGQFCQYLRDQLQLDDIEGELGKSRDKFDAQLQRYKDNPRYNEWLAHAAHLVTSLTMESLRDLYVTRILLARDELKRQLTLELGPLPKEELDERDSS